MLARLGLHGTSEVTMASGSKNREMENAAVAKYCEWLKYKSVEELKSELVSVAMWAGMDPLQPPGIRSGYGGRLMWCVKHELNRRLKA